MDAHNVKLVGVGLEEFGVEEFVANGYFKGDLYLDQNLATYKGLGFGRSSKLGVGTQLFGSTFRNANAAANAKGIDGNLQGDGLQYGGTYVIKDGGQVLFEHKQEKFGDHPDVSKIVDALGISAKVEAPVEEDCGG